VGAARTDAARPGQAGRAPRTQGSRDPRGRDDHEDLVAADQRLRRRGRAVMTVHICLTEPTRRQAIGPCRPSVARLGDPARVVRALRCRNRRAGRWVPEEPPAGETGGRSAPAPRGAEGCSVSQSWLSGSPSAKGTVGRCGLRGAHLAADACTMAIIAQSHARSPSIPRHSFGLIVNGRCIPPICAHVGRPSIRGRRHSIGSHFADRRLRDARPAGPSRSRATVGPDGGARVRCSYRGHLVRRQSGRRHPRRTSHRPMGRTVDNRD
jgi:hypothetical protein